MLWGPKEKLDVTTIILGAALLRAVILCGFSRGAIGVNYIGLHDDQIAALWAGFITHDHYDGVLEWKGQAWGSPYASS